MERCVLWTLANIFLFNALQVDGSLPIPFLNFEENIIEDDDTKITCTLPCNDCSDVELTISNVTMERCIRKRGNYPNVTCTVEVTREMHEMEFTCEAQFKTQSLPKKMNIRTEPEFTECPEHLVWLDGQETSFHCKAKGYPPPTVTCEKNNTIYKDGEKFTAMRNMSGEYICRATNTDAVKKTVMVSVEYKPKIIQSMKVNPPFRAEGDTVEITCEADGFPIPTYNWFTPSSYEIQFSPDKKIVKITNLKTDDLGIYECIVQNKHGTDNQQVTLTFAEKPKIKRFIIEPSTQVLKGANVTMTCEASGFPTPVLSWGNLKSNVEVSQDKHTAKIWGVKKEHEGSYSCEAKNTYGTDKQTQQLSIAEKPKILRINVQPPTTVEEGANVTLTCEASGLPSPTFSWKTQAPDLHYSPDKHVLYIRNAKKVHDGTYVCKVENDFGSDTHSAKISVKESKSSRGDRRTPIFATILATLICTSLFYYLF